MTNSIKLVKTAKCHQNSSKRPVIVPIFKNGLGKSPLEFLGFLFWPAFSPKELMGHFDAQLRIIVKTTKCRRVVHTQIGVAKGSHIPPRDHAASCSCGPAPHVLSAVFSTDPFLTVLHLIMTETGSETRVSNEACGRLILGQF